MITLSNWSMNHFVFVYYVFDLALAITLCYLSRLGVMTYYNKQ